jgi:hypothetical protein
MGSTATPAHLALQAEGCFGEDQGKKSALLTIAMLIGAFIACYG